VEPCFCSDAWNSDESANTSSKTNQPIGKMNSKMPKRIRHCTLQLRHEKGDGWCRQIQFQNSVVKLKERCGMYEQTSAETCAAAAHEAPGKNLQMNFEMEWRRMLTR
jgi:hypothetical protein